MADQIIIPDELSEIVRNALREDIGTGDVTTLSTIDEDLFLEGRLVAREDGVVAGFDVAYLAFSLLDSRVTMKQFFSDGQTVQRDKELAHLHGPGRALLTGERTALNLMQRMSGIATATAEYVRAVEGTGAVILDTRKTAPGLRQLDKMAVRMGGGRNHRMGLYDMALIKNNHITAVGGDLAQAVRCVKESRFGHNLPIEIEVRSLDELNQALELPVDRILLDNMSIIEMGEAVHRSNGKVSLEASGGITLENVAEIARTGVDFISIGALTHSVKALDISLWIS